MLALDLFLLNESSIYKFQALVEVCHSCYYYLETTNSAINSAMTYDFIVVGVYRMSYPPSSTAQVAILPFRHGLRSTYQIECVVSTSTI